jgi:competence protein ComGC
MYEEKSEDVFNRNPALDSNYYKTYFINRNYFYVHVYTTHKIEELSFIDTPIPYNVTVNGQEWWLSGINYTYKNDGIILSHVPVGHDYVDIYFKSSDKNSPTARIDVTENIVGIGEKVVFNGSNSQDSDGTITSYVWDFSTGVFKGGEVTDYIFTKEGIYNVILTVTDDDYLIDRAYTEIKVINRIMNISIDTDKPIVTPGSLLNHSIMLSLDSEWTRGVKNIKVECALPDDLNFISASPLPQLKNNTIIWQLGIAFETQELPMLHLQTIVKDQVENNTLILVSATLEYYDISSNKFPKETSNSARSRVNYDSIQAPKMRYRVNDIILPEDSPPYKLVLTQYEYDFSDSGNDLDWYITGKNETLYLISGEYSNDDTITITPKPNQYGDSLVTLWLVDSDGFTANQLLWINITPVNDPPIFKSAPDLILHYNEPYTFDYEPYVSDIDTPKEQLELLVLENTELDFEDESGGIVDSFNEHFQIDQFKITYNFPEKYVGNIVYMSLVIYDGSSSDGDTIQINITDDYTPKLMKNLPDVWLFEGETKLNVFDIDDYFEDPDQDSLYYSIGETHIRVNINEDNRVDITAPSDWNGVDTVTFRARDPIGAIAEDTILVTVSPLNDPPRFINVPEVFIVHYDADYTFELSAYIKDEDNELDELFLEIDDKHIRTDPNNNLKIILNYPKIMVGKDIPVKLIVSDGIDTDEQTTTVKVTDNWPPETIRTLSDISFHEDQVVENAFNLNDYFSDRDSNALFFTYGQDNIHITIDDDGTVDFSAELNWFGEERVTFRATDISDAFVESNIIITVHPVNDPPVIAPIPDQQGQINELWRVDLSEFINDVDNELSELTIETESTKLEINIKGRELLVYSNIKVSENISIRVCDGSLETVGYLNIEITGEEPKDSSNDESQVMLLILLIIMIIIVLAIPGFTSYRKYVGDYEVEEVFCISNTGLLISHVGSKRVTHRADKDVVSGMLTAIITFTQEAFTEEEKNKKAWGIKEIQMNEKNILVDRGEYTFLATVFSGRSGKKLYSQSRSTLNKLEVRYSKELNNWNGTMSDFTQIESILTPLLRA